IRWVSTLGLLLAAHLIDAQMERITGKTFWTRSEVLARRGMVLARVSPATQAGLDVFDRCGLCVGRACAARGRLGVFWLLCICMCVSRRFATPSNVSPSRR